MHYINSNSKRRYNIPLVIYLTPVLENQNDQTKQNCSNVEGNAVLWRKWYKYIKHNWKHAGINVTKYENIMSSSAEH